MTCFARALCCFLSLTFSSFLAAGEALPPVVTSIHKQGGEVNLRFAPYPSAEKYTILSGTDPTLLQLDPNFLLSPYVESIAGAGTTNYAYEWRSTNALDASQFYRVGITPMTSNAVVSAIALNRLAYGPTPDDLARVQQEGIEPWIAAQLAPWTIEEDVLNTHTNLPILQSRFASATDFVRATNTSIADFRAWHILRAVGARRQLLEILLQFLENHFVTEVNKTREWFGNYYNDSALQNRLAIQTEYLEVDKWRTALLNPQCTFYDLLRISAESPAMIVYLDTVSSRGDGARIANENYARELLELFTFGVDNGYEQDDITVMSRAWTGWTINKVEFADVGNPFASPATTIIPGSTNTSTTVKSNLYGAWTLNFRPTWHNTSVKQIFTNKVVPARFGPPWEGTSYQLTLANGGGTNGMRDGYQVIAHLANQPFTQEYLSIKLCRLLVHDDFPNPCTDPSRPEYGFYDYTAANLSSEARLVHACMMAWETNSPKGQIWKVVETIVNSELFRGQAAAQQKIKTPLELAVSTIRSLRSSTNGSNQAGSFTSFTDGYGIGGTSSGSITPLTRTGDMFLFNRESPDGYPEGGAPWISAGTLAERLRFLQAFCIAPSQSGHADAGDRGTGCDPVGLLRAKLPSSAWKDAAAVADCFLGLLYPGEGAANLSLYRQLAIELLNTDDNGNASPFGSLTVSGTANSAYDNRVRATVAALMTMQRFQEQ